MGYVVFVLQLVVGAAVVLGVGIATRRFAVGYLRAALGEDTPTPGLVIGMHQITYYLVGGAYLCFAATVDVSTGPEVLRDAAVRMGWFLLFLAIAHLVWVAVLNSHRHRAERPAPPAYFAYPPAYPYRSAWVPPGAMGYPPRPRPVRPPFAPQFAPAPVPAEAPVAPAGAPQADPVRSAPAGDPVARGPVAPPAPDRPVPPYAAGVVPPV